MNESLLYETILELYRYVYAISGNIARNNIDIAKQQCLKLFEKSFEVYCILDEEESPEMISEFQRKYTWLFGKL